MSVTRVGAFVWSPDGTDLYYTSNAGDSGTDEIFRIPTEGGRPQQLSRNPKGVRPEPKRDIVVSPDGKNIFYTSSRYFQNIVNIFKMPAAGGLGSALTFNDAGKGLVVGLCVAFIGLTADRLITEWSNQRKKVLGLA